MAERSGADAFLEQLVAADARFVFGNPGTNEQPLLGRIERYPELQYILSLHEAVAVGAAEGYARASGRVGVVQVHAGPGLGNAMGMLHNARAGGTPLVVYVGQAEGRTLYQEPTLGADLVREAAAVATWVTEVRTVDEVPQVLRRAFKVAMTPPRGPVVISIPMDILEQPTDAPVVPADYVAGAVRPDPAAVEAAAELLTGASAPVILVGDGVATAGAIEAVGRLAATLGAPIFGAFTSEVCVAPDDPLDAGRLPSIDGGAALKALQPYDAVLAIGTKLFSHVFPVAGLPLGTRPVVHLGSDAWELGKNQPGLLLLADERAGAVDLTEAICRRPADAARGEERRTRVAGQLADRRTARSKGASSGAGAEAAADGAPSADEAVAAIAAVLPPDVRLVDEALSAYGSVAASTRLGPGGWFRLRGGGIGAGMALPLGVRLADPERPVVSIVGDGAAIYTISALWTAAHHRIPVTWGVLTNREYRTLKDNARRTDANALVAGADLVDPEIDLVSVARGMGVAATRVDRAADVGPAFAQAIASGQPHLVDVVLQRQPASP